MSPVVFAMRRPVTVMVLLAGVVLCSAFALAGVLPERVTVGRVSVPVRGLIPLRGMPVDIFPDMGVPVIYVAQPYGGMDPAQMEGLITNYYEYHFLYIAGIEHVESRNVQGTALMKLFFHPGTDMSQALAETIAQVNRSRAFMPVGTVPPFVVRYDAGSLPVGFLTVSSATRTTGELQDLALFRVRPAFAAIPGVSAPPPFGGANRTAVVMLDPHKLRSRQMSPDEVVEAIVRGNAVSPSGSVRIGDSFPIVPSNSVVRTPKDLENIAVRPGANPTVFIRDVGRVEDGSDINPGAALVNGKRTIYLLVTKRSDASTLSVVQNLKAALPAMQSQLPDDVRVEFVFDQSPVVTGAMGGLAFEGALGAVLTGLMVLVFLRDWRSALVVVLNIPLALLSAAVCLWLTGNTLNIMTLGGMALAVGILVDEATVLIENIHARLPGCRSVAEAVRIGSSVTAVPRLLAMLCILAVFIPALFMSGAGRALFVPLSLAVGFSMIASYILSATFVPVMTTWLLRPHAAGGGATGGGSHDAAVAVTPRGHVTGGRRGMFDVVRDAYAGLAGGLVKLRWIVVPGYLAGTAAVVAWLAPQLGTEMFPAADAGQFRLRLRAPDGTALVKTEEHARTALDIIAREAGPGNIDITVGFVGVVPATYPINAVYEFMGGSHEAVLRVALKRGSGINVAALKERLRTEFAKALPGVRIGFEAGDIVSEVMSFGSPTPVEVTVNGPKLDDSRAHAVKLLAELAKIPALRDLQIAQSLDYPALHVDINREKAGLSGVTASDVSRSLVSATYSSRYVVANFWPDEASGIGYSVQVEVPQDRARAGRDGVGLLESVEDVRNIPVKGREGGQVLLRDVARVTPGTTVGEFARYNMKRMLTITAGVHGADLGTVSRQVADAVAAAGKPPSGVSVEVRGQIRPLGQMITGLTTGLALAVVVIFLLLTANFQSVRLSLTVVLTVPGVVAGVAVALKLTGTTLNVQSFMGAIMAVGVAVANAILLVTFAESLRKGGSDARRSAAEGAAGRLRAVLMTAVAMIAGMVPMASGTGEGGEATAPLARAVIGGLVAATVTTLLVLPCVFALLLGRAGTGSASLDPGDPQSRWHIPGFTLAADGTVSDDGPRDVPLPEPAEDRR